MFEKKSKTDAELTLSNNIVSEMVKIQDLDLENVHVFNAVLHALDVRNSLAKTLDPAKEREKKVILAWLYAEPPKTAAGAVIPVVSGDSSSALSKKIASLDADKIFSDAHHDNDIIKTYLSMVLKNKDGDNTFKIYQSFDKALTLKVSFSTLKGEEIVYRDKALDVPIYLLADSDVTLKVTDPYKFVKFVDINLQQITMPLIVAKILPMISCALRHAFLKCIEDNDICYYDLTKYYGAIAELLREKLQGDIADSGITVTGSYIKSTSIPNGTDKIFENQRIEFMQREKALELQHRAELLALENYEKKADIHKRYPDFEFGLTEKEKDNAVERYISRTSGRKEEIFQKSKDVTIGERSSAIGSIKSVYEVFADKLDVARANIILEIVGIVISAILLLVGISLLDVSYVGFVIVAVAIIICGFSIAGIVRKNEARAAAIKAQSPAMPTSTAAEGGSDATV